MASQGDEERRGIPDASTPLNYSPNFDISGDEAEDPIQQLATPKPHHIPGPPTVVPPSRNPSLLDGSERSVRIDPVHGRSSSEEAREAASKSQKGLIAYFGTLTDGAVRMENISLPATDIVRSDVGIKKMNERWKLHGVYQEFVKPAIRWIHLPGNNPDWVEGAMYHILDSVVKVDVEAHGWKTDTRFAEKTRREILRSGYWLDQMNTGLPNIPHSRFMRPFCRQMSSLPDAATLSGVGEHLVYLMPYLHWESSANFNAMTNAITKAIKGHQGEPTELAHRDFNILQAYLRGPNPMHIRRSLDQSYYSTLSNTSERDKDQVVQRYARRKLKKIDAECPMLMVDQCWLWILGGDTVLTAFPQQWSNQVDRPLIFEHTDVLGGILEDLSLEIVRARLVDAKTLAYLIIDRCACNIFDPDSIKDTELQFLRFFSESIDELTEAQSQSLKQLWAGVRRSQEEHVEESLFDISKDFETLKGIKDVMEELSMLSHVARQQKRVFRSLDREDISPLAAGMLDKSSHRGSSGHGRPIARQTTEDGALQAVLQVPAKQATSPPFHGRKVSDPQGASAVVDDPPSDEKPVIKRSPQLVELLQRAKERYLDFDELVDKARATYQALHDLLDLKQRQANLSEAMAARRSANEMEAQSKKMEVQNEKLQDQNNSIMLFTVVTILFLPLSSLASIFGINAVEFGQGHVTLARIFAYLFPISAFVVGFTFLLAFNQNIRMVILLWLEISGTWLLLWFPTVSVNRYVEGLQKKLAAMQKNKSTRGEARYKDYHKRKTERNEGGSAPKQEIKKEDEIARIRQTASNDNQRQADGQEGQHPQGDNQTGLANPVLAAGVLQDTLPGAQEDVDSIANGSANSRASTRAKIADPEVPRR